MNQMSHDTERIERLLKSVVDEYEKEDLPVRETKIRYYRKQKLYWNNISNIYWDEGAKDYRIYDATSGQYNADDQNYYDRPVNVYKAFLETVIAALSIQIPSLSCSPDDAENPNDQSTAKAGDKICELLYKHNDAIWLWLHALYIYSTEGLVACYNYEKSDPSYGMYKKRNYKDQEEEVYLCPHCKARIEESYMQAFQTGNTDIIEETEDNIEVASSIVENDELTDFDPDEDDIDLDSELKNTNKLVCPQCAVELDPNLQKGKIKIPRFVGTTDQPKSRICFDLFGELYVKISNSARKQEDTPYLGLIYETDYANVLECYRNNKKLWEKLPKGSNTPSNPDPYDSVARQNVNYREMSPENQVTVRNFWLRPSAFNRLNEEDSEFLHDEYPDGCKVVIVDDIVAEHKAESLDDHWTLTQNPTADYLSHDPLGKLLDNIQDITNDLISLILQTIEHGIPQTWADPSVVDFAAFAQLEATPGTVTPTKQLSGTKNVGEAFFQSKASALSPEVFEFYKMIQQLGQFVSAAMPSLFGGQQESGSSRTASEYAMTRTASLQRLQTPWRMFSIWWRQIFSKAVPAYMKLIVEDEHFVKKDLYGNHINVWIRKAELAGKIGSIELEAADTIPISDEQKADIIMRLMEMNNQIVATALMTPENLPLLRKVIKIPEFVLPGEEDRQKQYEEIQQLIISEPVVTEPDPIQMEMAFQAGIPPQPMEMPSIIPDEELDNHEVESQICRSWLIGEAGRLAKEENPAGYKNVLLHYKLHIEMLQQQQMMLAASQQMMTGENQNNENPNKSGGSDMIKGAEDAITPVR